MSPKLPTLALPFALLGSSCAATARLGPQYRVLPASTSVVAGLGTFGPGLGIAHDRFQLTIPAGLSVGQRIHGGDTESAFEIGTEFSAVGESNLGYRVGALVGAGLIGTTGAYLGLRGGPTLSLGRIEGDAWTPTVTLEGLLATQLGGATAGSGMLGVGLAFGWDLYGRFNIPSGRPLRDGDRQPWLPTAELGARVSRSSSIQRRLSARRLRESVGHWWLEEGLAEHASIASFLRMAFELAHLGAPARLVDRARAAAADEVRHARACFALATVHLGRELRPTALPSPAPRREASLALLAEESWLDGCVGEGTAAYVAAVRARRATDPQARRTWRMIARDEARHAELGWATLAWCLARGGDEVGGALESAVARTLQPTAM